MELEGIEPSGLGAKALPVHQEPAPDRCLEEARKGLFVRLGGLLLRLLLDVLTNQMAKLRGDSAVLALGDSLELLS